MQQQWQTSAGLVGLSEAILAVDRRFKETVQRAPEDLADLFGPGPALDALVADWLRDGVDAGGLEIVEADTLPGADAAYLPGDDLILLSRAALDGSVQRLSDILAEELGHRIDARVNGADSPGDEGESFAVLLRGEPLAPAEEDLLATFVPGYGMVEIETTVSVSDSGGYEGSSQTLTLETTAGGEISYYYQHYTIPDRFIIRYDGATLLDTGFTGGSQSGTIPLPAGTSDQLQVIVATDDQGTAWNYNVSVEPTECEDVTPWIVTSLGEEFERNEKTNKCEADASVEIGRTDGAAALFRGFGTPKVEYDKNGLKMTGATIRAANTDITTPLFYADTLELSFGNGTTKLAGVQQTGFELAGLGVDFKSMTVLRDRLAFDVDFKLPDAATGLFIDTAALFDDALQITSAGAFPVLGFKLDIPDSDEFKLLDAVTAQASGMSLAYRAQDDAFRLQGKLEIKNDNYVGGSGKFGFEAIEADLTGTNYLQVNTDGDVDLIGSLKATGHIGPAFGWTLKELVFTINTTSSEIGGSATLETPFGMRFGEGVEVKPEVEFIYPAFEWDKVALTIDNLNKPIPAYPLFFFQSIGGGIDNFAQSNPAPVEALFTIGATLGPQIGGARLARMQFDAKVTTSFFEGKATTDFVTAEFDFLGDTVGPFSLIKDESTAKLDWSKGELTFDGTSNVLDGAFVTTGKFKADTQFNFGFSRTGELGIPSFVPAIGGKKLAGANLAVNFTNDGSSANDYAAAWGTYRIDLPFKSFDITLGLRAGFDGTITRIGAGNIPQTSSWFVEPGREYLLLTASWETPAFGPQLRVIKPDGTVVTEAEFASHGMTIVSDFSGATARTVLIDTPEGGTWDMELVDETGLGEVRYEASGDVTAPGFTFTGAPVAVSSDEIRVDFDAAMDVPAASVTFYYDEDLTEYDGLRAGSAVVSNGTGSFTWDTTGVVPGLYYLYAMVDDGQGPITIAQTDTPVQAGSAADVSISVTTADTTILPGETITYTVAATNTSATDAATGVTVHFDLPTDGTLADSTIAAAASDYADHAFALGDIAPGGTTSFTVDVAVDAAAAAGDPLSASGYVLSETYDPEPLNDTSGAQLPVGAEAEPGVADLRVLSTLSQDAQLFAQDPFSYLLVVKNTGVGPATGIVLEEYLTNVADVAMDRPFTQSGDLYAIPLDDLDPGEVATVAITATAANAGVVRATTTVREAEIDGRISDNEDYAEVPVSGPIPDPADLSLDVSVSDPDSSGRARVTVDLTNAGPGIASSIAVAIALPAGATVTSQSALQGTYDPATGLWTVGNMRDALTRSLTLTVEGGAGGAVRAEVASVVEADPDSTPASDTGDDWDADVIRFAVNEVQGTGAADVLRGTGADDRFVGGGGDDLFLGNGGADLMIGGDGYDAAVAGNPSNTHTLIFTPDTILLEDRAEPGDLYQFDGVEEIDFDDGYLQLAEISSVADIAPGDLVSFVEMYIAYFNRAPDALGLYYWGDKLVEGMSMERIAAFFFDQEETRETYPDPSDTTGFVTQVYQNVLGRAIDQGGQTFWEGALDSGAVSRPAFVLEVLRGAKAPAPPDADPAFKAQKAADVAYLAQKTDLGLYYSVIRGMSDVDDARDSMALFDGTQAGADAAKDAIDAAFAVAADPDEGAFLITLTGVVDDPFAI